MVADKTVTMTDIAETLVSVDIVHISSFPHTLQEFHMPTVGDAAYINPVVHFLLNTSQRLTVNTSEYTHDPLLQLF